METNGDHGEDGGWRRTLAFEDLDPGAVYDCGTRSAGAEEMVSFAERFDPLPIHVDPDHADGGPFDGLIASGIHTLALSQSAAVEGFFGGSAVVASGGFEELRFPAPLHPDETMRVEVEVLGTRVSESDPRRGVVRSRRTGRVEGTGTVVEATDVTVWRRDGTG
jgi:acyl dehydratase